MIFIRNGSAINNSIINTGVINGNISNGSMETNFESIPVTRFKEMKSEDAQKVERITINSTFVDVEVIASKSSKLVEAHFFGEATVVGNINFEVCLVGSELKISLTSDTGCHISGRLCFTVLVPEKNFQQISVNTTSADITLRENVFTDFLKVKTQSGDLDTSATFACANISTKSGDVEMFLLAQQNTDMRISTTSGDVSINLHNIRQVSFAATSMCGNIKNHHIKTATGYYASVAVSTKSGDVMLR